MRDNSPRSQRKNKRSRSGDATKLSGKDLLVKTGHMTLFSQSWEQLSYFRLGVTAEWRDAARRVYSGLLLSGTRRPPVGRVHACVRLTSSNEGPNTGQ